MQYSAHFMLTCLLIAVLAISINTEHCIATQLEGGWLQTDANPGRSRNSQFSTHELLNISRPIASNLMMIHPISVLMDTSSLNFCSLGISDQSSTVLGCFGRDAQLVSLYQYHVPRGHSITKVLMDDNLDYYIAVYKTIVGDLGGYVARMNSFKQSFEILNDTQTIERSFISDMVITEFGLIILSGQSLINVDRKSGKRNWMISLGESDNGSKFLYDSSNARLFVSLSIGVYSISAQNGKILDLTPKINLPVTVIPALAIGKDIILIADNYNSNVTLLNRNNLRKGVLSVTTITDSNGKALDLTRCSNMVSRDSDSFFMYCTDAFAEKNRIFRFDVTENAKITLGFELNVNSMFERSPTTICSLSLAAYGKNGLFAVACKNGLVSFNQNGKFSTRNLNISVDRGTQTFGTLKSVAIFSNHAIEYITMM